MHTHMHTHTHTCTHTLTHWHAHSHTDTHKHTHTQCACTHVRMCPHIHAYTVISCSDQVISAFDCKKIWIWISLKECCHWLNKGFVYIAPSVSQFILLFQKRILFSNLGTLSIGTMEKQKKKITRKWWCTKCTKYFKGCKNEKRNGKVY